MIQVVNSVIYMNWRVLDFSENRIMANISQNLHYTLFFCKSQVSQLYSVCLPSILSDYS